MERSEIFGRVGSGPMTNDEAVAQQLEEQVGHPGRMLEVLKDRIQGDGLWLFEAIESEYLALMWTMDAYRVAGVPPRGMGKATSTAQKRLGAVYRSKGNWFAELLALLLQNRTSQHIAPRQRVQGFSQTHQIDIAWPARELDPFVCAETKVTGAPAYGTTPARRAMSDWTNRRKELKFAATDLKLSRRDVETQIDHWGVWRESAMPRAYFLWAARLHPTTDRIEKMVEEAQALVNTYLDGAGIFAWKQAKTGTGYESVPLPHSAQVTALDDVLHRIAAEINRQAPQAGTQIPPPVVPKTRAVEPGSLLPDE
ncbi:MAG: hypothetical protein ACRDL7_01665 [Gaiellaceae bacterium]